MGLREYRTKRDFEHTPEPEGIIADIGESRFVVQKHQASHLHYDFRLELDGVLKSWAVPKGPPLEPGIRRLAVQVEDHPVSYIDFSGSIPEGEYGAGFVEIWDRGTYTLDRQETDLMEITLRGEKLNGEYVLVHTGDKNWLLMKRKAGQGQVGDRRK
ncbi:MAG TPA: 3'-phosphoesterase [Dehalococcoidia bacterium]|nr:3'-phosphoesterase [Dehalococcoidia bacterium]